jgi:hypothetical protein
MNEEQMRAEFEAWWMNAVLPVQPVATMTGIPQGYTKEALQLAWQACQAVNDERIERLREALQPFANCAEQLEGEDDDEWAKFRLIVSDYRKAKTALEDNK